MKGVFWRFLRDWEKVRWDFELDSNSRHDDVDSGELVTMCHVLYSVVHICTSYHIRIVQYRYIPS